MITIKLGAADRDALGAPESMQVDPTRVRLAEIRALKRETGHTVESLSAALQNKDVEAVAALVWLALLRSGIAVAYDELDFDLADIDLHVAGGGKAPTPTSSGT